MTELPNTDASPAPAPDVAAIDLSSLLDQVIEQTGDGQPGQSEHRRSVETGIKAVIAQALRQIADNTFVLGEDRVNTSLIDAAIRQLDEEISRQLDQVMHHEKFQEMEGAWRSLKYLVDRAPLDKNVEVSVLNASKSDLDFDLQDQGPEKSGFLHHVYSAAMGTDGGKPYGAIVANYAFEPTNSDMRLLRGLAAVASASHAPMIAAAAPKLLGLKDMAELPNHAENIMAKLGEDRNRFAAWNAFREHPNSRYVGLTLPRFLLRAPYGPENKRSKLFDYTEAAGVDTKGYLWGNSAFAVGACLSRSFVRTRWCTEIVGPTSGGSVEHLPIHRYLNADGIDEYMCPTEIYLNDNQEYTLAELGFMGLVMRRESDTATFFSGQSVHKPGDYGQDADAIDRKTNHALAAHLPYTFIITRISHYLKLMMRQYIGSHADRTKLEDFVQTWVRGFVIKSSTTDEKLLRERPLKDAKVTVVEMEGKPGFYRFDVQIQPHLKFKGADISLSLSGQLDAKNAR
ncbi:MAG: type secretion system protein ImpC [Pseudomonadota bacterium]|jgi:type VI secretion system protein ImpC